MPETALDLTPKTLLNDDGTFMLQEDDIYALMKYTWTGVMLPVDEDAYKRRFRLTNDTMDKLSDVITPLLATYVKVQAHCQSFKDITYPAVVSLADDVYGYAQLAGDDVTKSSYAIIFENIQKLGKEKDKSSREDLKGVIDELIDVQVTTIADLTSKSQRTVTKLRNFESQTKRDQVELTERSGTVRKRLAQTLSNLDDLEKKFDEARKGMAKDMREYERSRNAAASASSYAWLGIFGLIAAVTTTSIEGPKAANMAKRINEMQKLIRDNEGKIVAERNVLADLNTINDGISNVTDLIDPTCKAIEKMVGVWSSISDDLTSLKRMVGSELSTAVAVVASIVAKKTVSKWNELAVAVDQYQLAACVGEAEDMSLDAFEFDHEPDWEEENFMFSISEDRLFYGH